MLKQNAAQLGAIVATTLLPVIGGLAAETAKLVGWAAQIIERFPVLGQMVGAAAAAFVAVGSALALASGFMWAKHAAVLAVTPAWSRLQNVLAVANSRLRAFNVAALVTGVRTRALAVGGAIKGFGASLLGLARRAIPAAIAGLRMLGIAAMTNPIGLVIGAIAVAAGLLYYYWEPISGFFGRLWKKVKAVFSAAWEGIKTTLSYHPLGLLITHWEPISGFFKGLWQGVKDWLGSFSLVGAVQGVISSVGAVVASFNPLKPISTAWNAVTDWLGSFSLVESGKAIIQSIAEGVAAMKDDLVKAVKESLGFVGRLLSFSDAKEGPLSRLTASGKAIIQTLGDGVRQAGPKPLGRPLARVLGTAATSLALALPAPILSSSPSLAETRASRPTPAWGMSARTTAPMSANPAQAAAGYAVHHHGETHITIHQLPGEDAQALAERVLEELDRRQEQQQREALYDGL